MKKAQGLSVLGRSNWKKRWFTLHQGALRYYDGCNPGHKGTNCKGMIETSQISAAEFLDDAFNKKCLFQVSHPDLGRAPYMLYGLNILT